MTLEVIYWVGYAIFLPIVFMLEVYIFDGSLKEALEENGPFVMALYAVLAIMTTIVWPLIALFLLLTLPFVALQWFYNSRRI